jgi:hypothetical protein
LADIEAIPVGKWSVGWTHHNPEGWTLLMLEFTDRAPINLAIPPEAAEGIAKAILENLRHPPPPPGRRN